MKAGYWSYAEALAAALFWGASFVATKVALREISPVTLIFLRFGMGVVILSFAVWRLRVFKMIGRRDWLLLAVLGAIGIPIHQGLQANGLVVTAATSVAWLVALTPVFTAILAWIFLSESFGATKTLGLVVAFAGALIVITKGALTSDVLKLPSTTGDFLALASSLNWAIFTIASKPVLKRLHPTLMVTYVMAMGWLLLLPVLCDCAGLERDRASVNRRVDCGWLSRHPLFRTGLYFLVRCPRAVGSIADGGFYLHRAARYGGRSGVSPRRELYARHLHWRLDDFVGRLPGQSNAGACAG